MVCAVGPHGFQYKYQTSYESGTQVHFMLKKKKKKTSKLHVVIFYADCNEKVDGNWLMIAGTSSFNKKLIFFSNHK